ncbi:MAG: response regulator [Bacteroidales bacterium]|nr:response regulator [Bacteroidales bacterium]MDP2236201.1 response regulator [Bacteroidales bacterium]
MKPLKIAIIDDEPDAIVTIELILNEFCKEVEVVAKANMIDQGYDRIRETEPDLVFLDIDMPRGSGFDLLERFPIRKFDVIFITAYSKYEKRAAQYGAFDYLNKPIDIEHFVKVIERFRVHLEENGHTSYRLML